MNATLFANPCEEVWSAEVFDSFDEVEADDDEEIIGEEMTADELEEVRRLRRNPKFVPPPAVDPIHERFGDDQLSVLAPFLNRSTAPSLSELDAIMSEHPMRSCRPGCPRHEAAMTTLARFWQMKGNTWNTLAVGASNLRLAL